MMVSLDVSHEDSAYRLHAFPKVFFDRLPPRLPLLTWAVVVKAGQPPSADLTARMLRRLLAEVNAHLEPGLRAEMDGELIRVSEVSEAGA